MLPNNLVRSHLDALEDLLGKNGVNAILNLSGISEWIEDYPPDNNAREVAFVVFSGIQTALEDIYGARMGRTLSYRAARQAFEQVGTNLIEFKLANESNSTIRAEIVPALNQLCQLVTAEDSPPNQVISMDEKTILQVHACPNCAGRKSDAALCQAFTGWLDGVIGILSASNHIEVEETACLAAGHDSCEFTIRTS